MIIHSRFKDYYDTATSYGVDTTVHYARESRGFDSDKVKLGVNTPTPLRELYPKKETPHGTKMFGMLIGFCGWIYPCIHTGNNAAQDDFSTELFFYDYAKYKQCYEQYAPKWYFYKFRYKQPPSETAQLFQDAPYQNDEPFIKMNTPIFIAYKDERNNREIICNPPLKPYQFFRIKDPVSAFQEIQMYLTNQLVKEKEVDVVEDKYRIAQHGFDKESFRHPIKL